MWQFMFLYRVIMSIIRNVQLEANIDGHIFQLKFCFQKFFDKLFFRRKSSTDKNNWLKRPDQSVERINPKLCTNG